MPIKVGLQLYTIRDFAVNHPEEALYKVAEYGYEGVEFAGYYGLSPEKMKKILDRAGLEAAGSHVALELLLEHTDEQLAYAKALGLNAITIPYLPKEKMLDAQVLRSIDTLCGQAEKQGIALSYHNHDFEFEKQGDGLLLDAFIKELPALRLELDTYWAAYAGTDAVEYMQRLGGRLQFVHVKDMFRQITDKDLNPNIGDGCMPIREIMQTAEKMNLEWAIVEMDNPSGEPMECVKTSLENLLDLIGR